MNNVDEILKLEIIDINHEGQGVAKKDNLVYFVESSVTGDKVLAKIVKVKKNFAICKVSKFIEKSENRVEPKCSYFDKCGGCQLLNYKYEKQLEFKTNRVINDFKKGRINLDNVEINDTLGMDNPYRYRNKTAFSVGKFKGHTQIGTYELSSHNLIGIDSCILQDELCDKLVQIIKKIFDKYRVVPYNKTTKKGNIRHIVIRQNKNKEIMLIVVTNKEVLENSHIIVEEITSKLDNVKTIIQNINNKRGSMILGYKNNVLYGNGTLIDYIGDLRFIISPHTFFQVNPTQTEKLYSTAIEFADISNNDVCFDIYCGIGTISLMAAKKAKKVIGIEIVDQSIKDAKINAEENNIYNTEFFTGKAEIVLPKLYNKGYRADVVIVDPPRKGCDKEVLNTICEILPRKIVYVSCNPATLVRDVKILEDKGYKLKKIQPVDMFCHSTHVETCVLLYREDYESEKKNIKAEAKTEMY